MNERMRAVENDMRIEKHEKFEVLECVHVCVVGSITEFSVMMPILFPHYSEVCMSWSLFYLKSSFSHYMFPLSTVFIITPLFLYLSLYVCIIFMND